VRKLGGDGNITTYKYDYENRLIGMVLPDGLAVEYAYCSCPSFSMPSQQSCPACGPGKLGGKRIMKKVGNDTTYYFYDSEDIILEFNESGIITAQYIHGPSIDEPAIMTIGNYSYYYVHDSGQYNSAHG